MDAGTTRKEKAGTDNGWIYIKLLMFDYSTIQSDSKHYNLFILRNHHFPHSELIAAGNSGNKQGFMDIYLSFPPTTNFT